MKRKSVTPVTPYRETLTVPSYLCNSSDKLSLSGLAAIFQEAAWQNAAQLGFAFTEDDTPVYWVLARLTVRIVAVPQWGQSISVTTWPSGTHRLYATREFVIKDKDQPLVSGGSSWIIVDAGSGKPVRPERYLDIAGLRKEHAVEHDFSRIGPLPGCSGTWSSVQPVAIDRNGHVNNTRYLDWFANWARGTSFESFVNDASGTSFVMTFNAETTLDHEYSVCGDCEKRQAEVRVRLPRNHEQKTAWTITIHA